MVYEADEYPLDEDAMLVLMDMAGWHYSFAGMTQGHYLDSNSGQRYRVPADEYGNTITNAFKMYLWLTDNHRSK